MLDATSLKALGRQMRRTYEVEPKGGIPDRIWRLLLDLERRTAFPMPPEGARANPRPNGERAG